VRLLRGIAILGLLMTGLWLSQVGKRPHAGPPPSVGIDVNTIGDEGLVDVVVRVLLADGLSARKTGPDRLEAGPRGGLTMEWCCVGEMLFGRALADIGERAWVHTISAGVVVAPAEIGRGIARIVRGLDVKAVAS
jgi:hypothetical protein